MSIGSIVIDLLAKTGSFETDLNRASKIAEKRAKEIDASIARMGDTINSTFVAIGAAAVIGAGVAFAAFDKLIKQAGELQDMAEKAGDSSEAFASIAVSAATAGVGMDTIAASSVRLTAALSKTDDEGKKVGQALAAIGLKLEDFKRLKPVDQMEAVAKALDGFKDGAEKTAIATALWGKSGAELLPFLKELAAEGGRNVILTKEQISLADQYADRQSKLRAEIGQNAQAIASQMLPAWNALAGAFLGVIRQIGGVQDGIKGLSNAGAIEEFSFKAVQALGGVVDWLDNAVRLVQMLGVGLGGAIEAGALAATGRFKEMAASAAATGVSLDKIANRKYFSSYIVAPKFADPRLLGNPGSIAEQTGKVIDTSGLADIGAGAKTRVLKERDWLEKRKQWLEEYDKWDEKEQAEILDTKRKLFIQYWEDTTGAQFRETEKQRKAAEEAAKHQDDYARKAAERIQSTFGNAIYDAMSGKFDSIGDLFADLMKRMVSEAISANIARAMFGDLAGGSGGGLFGSALKWFGGFFADGGDPPVGKVSMVGENGPELFVPRSAGTIIPNHALSGGTGGGVNISISNVIGNVASQSDVVAGMQVVRGQILSQLSRSARMGGGFA